MNTLLLMAKAVLTSRSMLVLLCIVGAVVGIRFYAAVIRKLSSKRGM